MVTVHLGDFLGIVDIGGDDMDSVSLATGGLFFSRLAHDLEELATMPGWTHPVLDRLPLLPNDVRCEGLSREQVTLAIGLIGVLMAAASIDGYRTRGRSPFYQAALYGYGMHAFSHLATAALARRYTPGVATALPVVLPFWIVAKRILRAHGVEVRPHRWVMPAFPVVAGGALGTAYLVTRRRAGGRD
ncbi:HXXEE domain-containing protein [Actinomyces viscosus]|uniref:Uncharacterized protein n=2 Tax=Actinomyces viscosus TaxID=1656 RepID=A0A3S4VYD4_ACTVI|nr:HXXEE domain-containing protein [Actinomyces viscosus]VEI17613.1 Uncharacterised protein [Actinomyces viscosus]